jgi:hypothetical protein
MQLRAFRQRARLLLWSVHMTTFHAVAFCTLLALANVLACAGEKVPPFSGSDPAIVPGKPKLLRRFYVPASADAPALRLVPHKLEAIVERQQARLAVDGQFLYVGLTSDLGPHGRVGSKLVAVDSAEDLTYFIEKVMFVPQGTFAARRGEIYWIDEAGSIHAVSAITGDHHTLSDAVPDEWRADPEHPPMIAGDALYFVATRLTKAVLFKAIRTDYGLSDYESERAFEMSDVVTAAYDEIPKKCTPEVEAYTTYQDELYVVVECRAPYAAQEARSTWLLRRAPDALQWAKVIELPSFGRVYDVSITDADIVFFSRAAPGIVDVRRYNTADGAFVKIGEYIGHRPVTSHAVSSPTAICWSRGVPLKSAPGDYTRLVPVVECLDRSAPGWWPAREVYRGTDSTRVITPLVISGSQIFFVETSVYGWTSDLMTLSLDADEGC